MRKGQNISKLLDFSWNIFLRILFPFPRHWKFRFFFISDMPLLQAPVRAKKFRWHDVDFCSWISDVDRLLHISFECTVIKNFIFTAVVIDFFRWRVSRCGDSDFVSNIVRFLICEVMEEIHMIRSYFVWFSVATLNTSDILDAVEIAFFFVLSLRSHWQ